jgi:hypothetical protein
MQKWRYIPARKLCSILPLLTVDDAKSHWAACNFRLFNKKKLKNAVLMPVGIRHS